MTLSPKKVYADLITHYIKDEKLVFISSIDDEIDEISEKTMDTFNEKCFIFTEGDCSLKQFFENFIYNNDIQPKTKLSFSSIEAIKYCVISNLGISLLPEMSIVEKKNNKELKIIKCYNDNLHLTTQYSYHKDKWISPVLQYFISLVDNILKE